MQRKHSVRMLISSGLLVLLLTALSYMSFHADAQGSRMQYGDTVNGAITGTADSDTWSFDGVQGDVVLLQVARAEGELVPAIRLTDPNGGLVLDAVARGPSAPELTLTVGLQQTGTYSLTVRGVEAAGGYTLTLALQTAGEMHAEDDTVLVYGRSKSGTISDETYRAFWTFQGTRGDLIDVYMTPQSGDLDPFIALQAPDGGVITSSGANAGEASAALYGVRLSVTGTYTVIARRTGANLGAAGDTRGDYHVELRLREAGGTDDGPVPTELTLDRALRGRLSTGAPVALFEVQADGVLALALHTNTPTQINSLKVLTPDAAVLHHVSGLSPLLTSISLPGDGRYQIEVSAADIRDNQSLDFSLSASELLAATQESQPLLYDQPQMIPSGNLLPASWHFYGRAGDLVRLNVRPFGATNERNTLSVIAPDGTLVLESDIHGALEQPLRLTMDGAYEIVFKPEPLPSGYHIEVTQTGIDGLAFDQRASVQSSQPFPSDSNASAEGELQAYTTDAWLLDIKNAQTWTFALTTTEPDAPLMLVVEAPDGTRLGTAGTDRLVRTAHLQLALPQMGRYRVLVAKLDGQDATTYRLAGSPVEGATLVSNLPQKGVLTATTSYDRWHVRSDPGDLINVRIAMQQGATTLPVVHIIGPDGVLLRPDAQLDRSVTTGTLSVFAETGGLHTVLVQQASAAPRIVYEIVADVSAPFEEPEQQQAAITSASSPVLVAEATPVPQPARVMISDVIAPALPPGSEVFEDAQRVETGTLTRGIIVPGQRFQAWEFAANVDQLVEFNVVALEDASGPDVTVLDSAGDVVTEHYRNGGSDSRFTHRFAASDTYTLLVKLDSGGPYTMRIDTLARIDERVPEVIPARALSYGQTLHDQLSTTNSVRSYVFDGQAGDVITGHVATVSDDPPLALALSAPDNSVLAEASADRGARIVGLDEVVLPDDGLYRLAVSPASDGTPVTGRFSLRVDRVQAKQLVPSVGRVLDTKATVRLSAADPSHRWLFSAQAGESITLRVVPLAAGAPAPVTLELADSSGTVFARRTSQVGSGALILDDVILPCDGLYLALIKGGQREPGTYCVILERDVQNMQDTTRTLQYGASAHKLLTRDNFLDVWTFAGSQGDVISIATQYVRGDETPLTLQLRTDSGQVLATVVAQNGRTGARITQLRLPQSGHYTAVVSDPDGEQHGATAYRITLLLQGTSAQSIGAPFGYGDIAAGAFFIDDPADTWVFEGQQGDVVTAWLESATPGMLPALALLSTDWHTASISGQRQVLADAAADNTGTAELTFTLPTDGVYALAARSPSLTSGQYKLRLINETPLAGPAVPLQMGRAREGQVDPDARADHWRFDASADTLITITVTPNRRTTLIPSLTLRSPDGAVLAQSRAGPQQRATITSLRLPYDGAYAVDVSSAGGAGGYTILVAQDTVPHTSSVQYRPIALGRVLRGSLNQRQPAMRWTFEGEPGDTIRAQLQATTNGTLDPVVRVFAPDGHLLAEADDTHTDQTADLVVVLPVGGTYVVEASRYHGIWGTTAGGYVLQIDRVFQGSQNSVPVQLGYGDRVTGATSSGNPSDQWSFRGTAGDTIYARVQVALDDVPLTLLLHDAAGNLLARGERKAGDVGLNAYQLSADGVYTLEVDRPADAAARFNPYALDLVLLDTAASTPVPHDALLLQNDTVTARLDGGTVHTWLYAGQAGEGLSLSLVPLNSPLTVDLSVRAPDDTLLHSRRLEGQTRTFMTGTLSLPVSGLYVITLSVPSGFPNSRYRLAIRTTATVMVTERIAVGDDGFGTLTDVQPFQHWQFVASAGTVIDARASRMTGGLVPTLQLLGPSGSVLATGYAVGDVQSALSRIMLPVAGDYTLVVSREGGLSGTTSGDYRLLVRQHALSERAAAAKILAPGVAQPAVVDRSGPLSYTFRAEAGDSIALAAQVPVGQQAPRLHLETEAGRELNLPITSVPTETRIDSFVVPRTGVYVVVLSSEETVNAMVAVHRRLKAPVDGSDTRPLGLAQTLVGNISDSGVADFWSFSGTQGDVLTFIVNTEGGQLRADVTLFGSDGYAVSTVEAPNATEAVLGPLRLPVSGEYKLVVGARLGTAGGSTGRYMVRMDAAEADVSGSQGGQIVAYGQPVFGGVIPQDATDAWTFSGQAGELVVIRAEYAPSDSKLALTLRDPDDAVLGTSTLATLNPGAEIQAVELPVTGKYTVTVEGQFVEEQPVEYQLVVSAEQQPGIHSITNARGIAYGDQASGALSSEQPRETWMFYGAAGDAVRVSVMSSDTALAPVVRLHDPEGAVLRSASASAGGDVVLHDVMLVDDGIYMLSVAQVGAYLSAARLPYVITLERTVGHSAYVGVLDDEERHTLTPATPVNVWSLQAPHDGIYAVVVESLTPGQQPALHIMSGAGDLLASGDATLGGSIIAQTRMAAGRPHTAVVSNGIMPTHMRYRIRLIPASMLTNGGMLVHGAGDVGRITHAHLSDQWQFEGMAGDSVQVVVERTNGTLCPMLALYDANGLLLREAEADDSGETTLAVDLPANGVYQLVVTRTGHAVGMTTGDYSIVLKNAADD